MGKWKQMEMVAALQARQSAFIFSADFMPSGRQNCLVKRRFIRNQSKQLVSLLCGYMCNQLRNDTLKQKARDCSVARLILDFVEIVFSLMAPFWGSL